MRASLIFKKMNILIVVLSLILNLYVFADDENVGALLNSSDPIKVVEGLELLQEHPYLTTDDYILNKIFGIIRRNETTSIEKLKEVLKNNPGLLQIPEKSNDFISIGNMIRSGGEEASRALDILELSPELTRDLQVVSSFTDVIMRGHQDTLERLIKILKNNPNFIKLSEDSNDLTSFRSMLREGGDNAIALIELLKYAPGITRDTQVIAGLVEIIKFDRQDAAKKLLSTLKESPGLVQVKASSSRFDTVSIILERGGDKALEILDLIAVAPELTADVLVISGLTKLIIGKNDEGLNKLKEILRDQPDLIRLSHKSNNATSVKNLLNKGNEQTLEMLELIRLAPGFTRDLQVIVGLAEIIKGDFKEAKEKLFSILESNPNAISVSKTSNNFMTIRNILENLDQRTFEMLHAIELAPDFGYDRQVIAGMKYILENGDEEQIAKVNNIINLYPDKFPGFEPTKLSVVSLLSSLNSEEVIDGIRQIKANPKLLNDENVIDALEELLTRKDESGVYPINDFDNYIRDVIYTNPDQVVYLDSPFNRLIKKLLKSEYAHENFKAMTLVSLTTDLKEFFIDQGYMLQTYERIIGMENFGYIPDNRLEMNYVFDFVVENIANLLDRGNEDANRLVDEQPIIKEYIDILSTKRTLRSSRSCLSFIQKIWN